ncbi:MAG: flippase-like domain-containing protein [Synergistetes bacterium]|nr:flippase-like domain-containing protein [Synergistota bacterium]
MKRKQVILLRIGFSFAIGIGILCYVGVERVLVLLSSTDIAWFVLLILVITADRFLMAYKWSVLLKARGIEVSFLKLVRLYYIGTFVGLFLPATVGGDLLRVYLLSRDSGLFEDVFSSVVVERLGGFFSSLVFALISVLLLRRMGIPNYNLIFYFVVLLVFFFPMAIFLSAKEHLAKRLYVIFPERIRKWSVMLKLKNIYISYVKYTSQGKVLIGFFVLSLLEQLFPILGNYISARAIGFAVSIWVFLVVIPIVLLVTRIPISFNGIGINEGLLVYFFSLLGLSTAGAFSIGLLGHVGVLLACVPGFIFYIWDKKSIPAGEG